MKKKISRILGMGLTVALLASLILAVLPVSAAPLQWSPVSLPSTNGNVIVPAAWDITAIAVSPNYSSDHTVFAGTAAGPVTPTVFRSPDGGHNWIPAVMTPAAAAPIVDVVVSPSFSSDSTVFATDGANVYISNNGGASFNLLGSPLLGTCVITDLAVAPDYSGGGCVAIGVADPVTATMPTALNGVSGVWIWGFGSVLAWAPWSPTATLLEDVTTVEFSPAYPLDATILAVGSNNTLAQGTRLHTCAGTGAWDIIGPPIIINAAITDLGGVGTDIITSSLAVGDDFNATIPTSIREYVSTVSNAVANDDIYRCTSFTIVQGLAAPDVDPATPLVSRQYSSLAYSGDFATGTLFAGTYDAAGVGIPADVYRCPNPTAAASWLWYGGTPPANRPSGTTAAAGPAATIAITSDFATSNTLFVGSMGVDSAVAVTTNGGVSFNETGLIDTPVIATSPFVSDAQPSPNYAVDHTIYLVTTSAAAGTGDALVDSLWQSTNEGNAWERMDWMVTTNDSAIVRVSDEYSSNNTVYWAETVAGVAIRYSGDAGQIWSARVSPAPAVDIAAPDATTFYVASGGNVIKSFNSGWTWLPASGTGVVAINDIEVSDSLVLVASTTGNIAQSTDGAGSFAPVGAPIGAGGASWVSVDADNDAILATEAAGNVYRWDSPAWTPIDIGGSAASSGIVVADDGTVYQADPTAGAAVRRSLNPLDPITPLPPVFESAAGTVGFPAAFTLANIAEADNVLFCVENSVTPAADFRVMTLTDTLSAGSDGPSLNGPADGEILTITNLAPFNWNAVAGATAYTLQFDTNADFSTALTPLVSPILAPATSSTQALPIDLPWNWRVQVALGSPLVSPWSDTWVVQPQLVTAPNSPAPVQPLGMTAINVSTNPVFNWTALLWANNYKFQLATDAEFTNLLVDESLGNVTSYAYVGDLDYSGTYYWRVMAESDATSTDWSAGVGFQTMIEPVDAGPTEIIVEQPDITVEAPDVTVEAPSTDTGITPGYIWAIIGVGAVLVIVVIVLIVRTRRAV